MVILLELKCFRKNVQPFIKYSKPLDEKTDEGSIFLVDGDFFIETEQLIFEIVERSNYGEGPSEVNENVEEKIEEK